MKRPERMNIVRSVAEHEEQMECRAMSESQRKLDDELERLEELKAYRQSYTPSGKLRKGLRGLEWQDYHRFLCRLDQALAAQEQVVCDGKSRRKVHEKRWTAKRQRLESLSRVIDRHKTTALVERERQLNRLQDSQPIHKGPLQDDSPTG